MKSDYNSVWGLFLEVVKTFWNYIMVMVLQFCEYTTTELTF